MKNKTDRIDRQLLAQKCNIDIQCSCCYDTYYSDDVISCNQSQLLLHNTQRQHHSFCGNCIQSQLENLLFSQGNLGYEMNNATNVDNDVVDIENNNGMYVLYFFVVVFSWFWLRFC